MSNRDELRQAVARALRNTDPYGELVDYADADIAAYERHRPRPDVVLTREEWHDAMEAARGSHPWAVNNVRLVLGRAFRAAFPWIKVEGE